MSRARGDSNGARRVPQRRHQAARGTHPGYERSEYLRVSPPAGFVLPRIDNAHSVRVPRRRHEPGAGRLERSQARTAAAPSGGARNAPGYERSEYLRVSPPANLRLHLLVSLHTRSQVLSVSRGYGAGRLERSQARTGPRPQGAGGTHPGYERSEYLRVSPPAGFVLPRIDNAHSVRVPRRRHEPGAGRLERSQARTAGAPHGGTRPGYERSEYLRVSPPAN